MSAEAHEDPHRPRFHLTASSGWLNDPNGFCEWDGRFHLFYQHNPHAPVHGDIHWGHVSSGDLVHWVDEPIALVPGPGADVDGCWSGVLVDDGGVPTLVYSGHREGVGQRTCLAYGGPDLRTWRKELGNPVIADPPEGLDVVEYRDHCVWREDGEWRQLMGAGLRGGGGTALLYRSADLRSWDYVGPLVTAYDDAAGAVTTGTTWECVDLFRLGGDSDDAPDVLVMSAWDAGVTLHSACLVGRYDGRHLHPVRTQLLDLGLRHFYAPQTMRTADGRRIMVGWMQEGRADSATAGAGWSGVMSLPRELRLDTDGRVLAEPVAEVATLRHDHRTLGPVELSAGDGLVEVGDAGVQLDLEVDVVIPVGSVLEIHLRATPDGAERTVLRVDGRHGGPEVELALDRSASSLDATLDVVPLSGPVPVGPDRRVTLRVLLDRSALEVFANGVPLSARIYPTRPDATGLVLRAVAGSATCDRVDLWRMAGVWNGMPRTVPTA